MPALSFHSFRNNASLLFVISFSSGVFRYAERSYIRVCYEQLDLIVDALLGDSNGFLWLGTINGLARYDGYEFKRFVHDPSDSSSINVSLISALFEDSRGNIWIGSNGAVDVYDPRTRSFQHLDFSHLMGDSENRTLFISCFIEDSQGRIFMGINDSYFQEFIGALLYYDELSGTIQRYPLPNGLVIKNIFDLCIDDHKNMWISTYDGIIKLDARTASARFITSYSSDSTFYTAMVRDIPGLFWVATNKSSMGTINTTTGQLTLYSFADSAQNSEITTHSLLAGSDVVWMATDRGLVRFDVNRSMFSTFDKKADLAHSGIIDLEFDAFGGLWMGTISNGLLKYEPNKLFESFSFDREEQHSITQGWVGRVIEDNRGRIWTTSMEYGSPHDGVSVFDPQSRTFERFFMDERLADSGILGIYENASNEFYLGTSQGVFLFSPSTGRVRRIFPEIETTVYEFHKDSQGNLWMGTNNGLFQNPSFQKVIRYDLASLPGGKGASNVVTRFFESPSHGLWILTNYGLFRYDFNTQTPILEFFKKCNITLKKMQLQLIYMALTVFKLENHVLQVSAAGMPPVYFYSSKEDSLKEITLKGMPLGAVWDFDYQWHKIAVQSGDVLFFMSDGFPELFNLNHEILGYDRVPDILAPLVHKSPQEIVSKLVEYVQKWAQGHPHEDDITFVVLKVNSPLAL